MSLYPSRSPSCSLFCCFLVLTCLFVLEMNILALLYCVMFWSFLFVFLSARLQQHEIPVHFLDHNKEGMNGISRLSPITHHPWHCLAAPISLHCRRCLVLPLYHTTTTTTPTAALSRHAIRVHSTSPSNAACVARTNCTLPSSFKYPPLLWLYYRIIVAYNPPSLQILRIHRELPSTPRWGFSIDFI